MSESLEFEEFDYDETGLKEPGPGQPSMKSKKRRKRISCPICQLDCRIKLRRYEVREHLPSFMAPSLTCLSCGFMGTAEDSLDQYFCYIYLWSGLS